MKRGRDLSRRKVTFSSNLFKLPSRKSFEHTYHHYSRFQELGGLSGTSPFPSRLMEGFHSRREVWSLLKHCSYDTRAARQPQRLRSHPALHTSPASSAGLSQAPAPPLTSPRGPGCLHLSGKHSSFSKSSSVWRWEQYKCYVGVTVSLSTDTCVQIHLKAKMYNLLLLASLILSVEV